ncbi:sugar transporter [Roseibaca sp. Y0-43]|nr:sugar transporter [Roseibaca sp. Y0-43]
MVDKVEPSPDKREKQSDRMALEATNIRPPARSVRWKLRHNGLLLSTLVVIGLPVLLVTIYLTFFAKDQYASTVGFTVRQAETSGASELMGGLTSILGAGAQNHSDLLFEFVQSQEMVQLVSEDFDLIGHYSQNWPYDPIYSIWPSATIEDQTWFWNRMVRVTYDKASGMMVLQVRAHDPEIARELATLIIRQSEEMINRLNSEARADATRNAEADLETALERLRAAREALVKLRVQTQIVDPEADIEAQMGVLMNFQQQLAEALVEYDILSQTSELTDPRLRQLELRIEVIRERIRDERLNGVERNVTTDGTDYPNLIAQFERLEVDQAFAEIAYQAALTALDVARSNAARQSLFLANFIRPTLAQRAEYPQTIQVIGLTFFFGLMFWAVLALVYYSLRDRG